MYISIVMVNIINYSAILKSINDVIISVCPIGILRISLPNVQRSTDKIARIFVDTAVLEGRMRRVMNI